MKVHRNVLFLWLAGVLAAAVGQAQEVQSEAIVNWPAPLLWSSPARAVAAAALAEKTSEGIAPLQKEAASPPLPFVAITPCRIADTRGNGFSGSYGPPSLSGGVPRNFPLAGQCGIASGAAAVSLNITVTNTLGPGFILIYPQGGDQPVVSTLNYVAGQTVANAAVVPLGTGGGVTVIAGVSGTDLIIDTNGYYAGGVVKSLNTLSGDVTLTAGTNVTITPSGQTLTIASTGGGGGVPSVNGITGAVTVNGAGSVSVGTAGNTITVTGPGSLPPSGTAGGSLAGSYPNPSLANGAVSESHIAGGQVVKRLNGATDALTVTGAGATTVSTLGNAITVSSPIAAVPSGTFVLGKPNDTTLIGVGFSETGFGRDFWSTTTTAGAASARAVHTAVWTGTKMIIWGGLGSAGLVNTGRQYDPVADSWTATSTTGAPAARSSHTAVWTGTKMIVWGGCAEGGCTAQLNTGGLYDPVGDSWTATTIVGAPSARTYAAAVWTGAKMIVWGGGTVFIPINTGGQYDPVGDSWTATTTNGVPTARNFHTAVWTGTKMIVWGGCADGGCTAQLNTGGLYDPVGDSWTATTIVGAPTARFVATAVWTGAKMIVWGGIPTTNTGGQYDPMGDSWTATTTNGAPTARNFHTAVWTGTKMIVWGGFDGTALVNTGGQYDPVGNVWTVAGTTTAGVPAERKLHTAVWTGAKMIVWGGCLNSDCSSLASTGGRWSPLSLYVKN